MKAEEVKNKIGKENWKEFSKFMEGQTVGFDKGVIDYYECDVDRFMSMIERNPAHFCDCGKFLGHRGFCSQKCHDEHYDDFGEGVE